MTGPARPFAALAGLFLSVAMTFALAAPLAAKPNVIIILADDAGYADFGFQGSREIETPNIDLLARSGTVFEQAYATTPFCSPSRAGLLTGRHPLRYGYEFNLTHDPPPGVDRRYMGLAVEERTVGDLFRAAGYRTIAVGKWHLGLEAQFHPNRRGFDHFYGILGGNSRYFPKAIVPGSLERNGDKAEARTYLTDDFAREAVEQIDAAKGPFLLYLAFTAPHTPMDTTPQDLARFGHIADPQRRRLAAMTWAMDRGVGEVLRALKRRGIERETLVVFTNDNGGDRIGLGADNGPLRGTKGTLLEGGIRVPLIVRYPGASQGHRHASPVSLLDIAPTILRAARLPLPTTLDGHALSKGADGGQPRTLHWRYDSVAAMRQGPWKLLRFPDRPAQLYHVVEDKGETTDLASAQPERLAQMMRELFAWEGTVEHPRWHTGSFWSQEDVRRYAEDHIRAETAKAKVLLTDRNADFK